MRDCVFHLPVNRAQVHPLGPNTKGFTLPIQFSATLTTLILRQMAWAALDLRRRGPLHPYAEQFSLRSTLNLTVNHSAYQSAYA